jgi:hypothetical protein
MSVNPSTRTTEEPGPPVLDAERLPHYDGKRLTFRIHETLPHACLRCGKQEGDVTYRKHIFVWVPPLAHLSLLCGVIPFFIFQNMLLLLCGVIPHFILKDMLLQRVEPTIPLCVRCHSVVTTAEIIRSLAPSIVFLVVIIFGILGSADVLHLGHSWAFVGAVTLFAIYRRFVADKRLIVTRIRKDVIVLKGVSDAAARVMVL